jgi:hypothetical protein
MKIATFNVNDVKKRLPNLLGWLRRARADVACLQELKTTDSEIRSRFGNRRRNEMNIRNSHFYLRGYVSRFPSDLLGGSNKDAEAPKKATIDWGSSATTVTDIDGEKQFFRRRGWIKQFFERTGANVGDWVLVEETGPYQYKVSLKKTECADGSARHR